MSAWIHSQFWSCSMYAEYRKFVQLNAEGYMGDRHDCADLSMLLLIDFAAGRGLPVTLTDLNDVHYISKGERQSPTSLISSKKWANRDEYANAVMARLNAKALLTKNVIPNPQGPQPGDLMLKGDHAAIVYQVYPPGVSHPRSSQFGEPDANTCGRIPKFPGNDIAKTQLDRLIYFRSEPPQYPVCTSDDGCDIAHIDFLNHRGFGKENAELMLFAEVPELQKAGFDFFMYSSDVLDNWADWNGTGTPPRIRTTP